MKKLFSILMLLLLVYNFLGYYIVFYFQHQDVKNDFEEYVHQGQYEEEDLKLFKVPITVYSETTSSDFSRVAGDFEYDGKFYQIIKQYYENDTLYTYCLNNEKEEQLLAQLYNHILNHGFDTKSSKSDKNDNLVKNLLKEYLPKNSNIISAIQVCSVENQNSRSYYLKLSSIYLSIPNPPPELG